MRARTIAFIVIAGLSAAALASACTLPDSADDVFPAEGERPGAGSAQSSGAGGKGGEGGSLTASSSTGQAGGGMGGMGAGGMGAGGMGSGGMGGAGGAGGMGSGGMGPIMEVWCSDSPCAPGEVCCWHQFDGSQDTCAAPGSCGQNFAEITCNDIEDCPAGQACCGDWNGDGYDAVSCHASCAPGQIIMCEGHPELCPAGDNCSPSSYLGDGYSACQ